MCFKLLKSLVCQNLLAGDARWEEVGISWHSQVYSLDGNNAVQLEIIYYCYWILTFKSDIKLFIFVMCRVKSWYVCTSFNIHLSISCYGKNIQNTIFDYLSVLLGKTRKMHRNTKHPASFLLSHWLPHTVCHMSGGLVGVGVWKALSKSLFQLVFCTFFLSSPVLEEELTVESPMPWITVCLSP